MSKHFIINPSKNKVSEKDISLFQTKRQNSLKEGSESRKKATEQKKNDVPKLKHTHGRIIIQVDTQYKNQHTFEDGTNIYIGRQFNNLNRRETEPVNAIVIDSEYIHIGSEILIHPNSISESNKINGYANLSSESGNDIRYYSIEENSAFLYRNDLKSNWLPLRQYCIALRVFKPYTGTLQGISPKQLKNILYIVTGEHAGKVCHTVNASDYEIIFMNEKGKEQRIIRCRHYENQIHDREELTCINHLLTERVLKGELLVGLNEKDCKILKQYQNG